MSNTNACIICASSNAMMYLNYGPYCAPCLASMKKIMARVSSEVDVPKLEICIEDTPIRAYKRLALRKYGPDMPVGIYPHYRPEPTNPIAVDSQATCQLYHQLDLAHIAPVIECTCGYYGYKELDGASLRDIPFASYIADCDFYGTVIEHDYGYRAEYQRIMRIMVCNKCAVYGCPNSVETNYLYWDGAADIDAYCKKHTPNLANFPDWRKYTVIELSNELGTEVYWESLEGRVNRLWNTLTETQQKRHTELKQRRKKELTVLIVQTVMVAAIIALTYTVPWFSHHNLILIVWALPLYNWLKDKIKARKTKKINKQNKEKDS